MLQLCRGKFLRSTAVVDVRRHDGMQLPVSPLESAIVPLNPNSLSLHILQWELAELWSRNPQRKSPIKQPSQINRRERERGKSVRLIRINRDALVIWPWLIHDLLLLDTGNGCLITSIKEQPLSQRINVKDYDTGAQEAVHTVCDVLWSALSFTITRALRTLPIYTTSCFCAVTVNALKIFVLDCASPV